MNAVTVTITADQLSVDSPFNRSFVDDLKRYIPKQDRAWDGSKWNVNPKYRQVLEEIVISHYQTKPLYVDLTSMPVEVETRVLKLDYLGRCKPAGDIFIASGWVDGGWNVHFLESSLRDFFQAGKSTTAVDETNFYTILAVDGSAPPDVIKRAFRRLARQWHPDVNPGDKDAEEMFRKINEANQVLSDPMMRRKYDFALKLERESAIVIDTSRKGIADDRWGYRAPLRCGYVVVDGRNRLGKFLVSKIHSWDDIIKNGKVMVSSWTYGDLLFTIRWV